MISRRIIGLLFLILVGATNSSASLKAHSAAVHEDVKPVDGRWSSKALAIPDVMVRDQDGRSLRFYSDLIKGQVVAINFVFTGCSTICPGLTTTFRNLQDLLGTKNVRLISITVDPANDGPAELKKYAASFDAKPGWSFVTGRPDLMTKLLKSLSVSAIAVADHSSLVIIYNDAETRSTQVPGIASAADILKVIEEASSRDRRDSAANARYFTNLPLQTQDGRMVRFYEDLVRGRVVLINFIYTNCPDICSPVTDNLAKVQDRLGTTVNLISISADPERDTPEMLKRYALNHGAREGWTFLTAPAGKKANVDWVAYRLGGYAEDPAAHGTMLMIGNDATGEWVKMPALSDPERILAVVARLGGSTAR